MKVFKIALALSALGLSSITLANTGTITINGKIYDETCILSASAGQEGVTGIKDVTVRLATIPSNSFTSVVREFGLKDFTVELTNSTGSAACYNTTTLGGSLAPVVTLSATADKYDASNPTNLLNQAGTASSSNPVYIQILAKPTAGAAGTAVDYTSSSQAKATYDSTNNKFYYAAQYSAGTGTTIPAAQDVTASVTYTITYP